jgi:hypothetical protein
MVERVGAGPERDETPTEKLDRNWASLLQELRVAQTGVQLLTGLLLTLPFHDRFAELSALLRAVYLVTVGCSIASTVLLASPVAMHRVLFRQHRLDQLVAAAHKTTYVGLMFLGISLVGVTVLVFGAVTGDGGGVLAGAAALVAFLLFWVVLPVAMRAKTRSLPGSRSR